MAQRPEETIWELWQRLRREPEVPVMLVEGCCEVCYCCDGYHPPTTGCVHGDGIVRSDEWAVCGGAEGCVGYEKTRETGFFCQARPEA